LAWEIKLTNTARKQLKKLDHEAQQRIHRFLIERVRQSPRDIGKALKSQMSELWRYRVGDYRIVCEIQDTAITVLVVRIGHRREVYRS
jgi:mRNA interferase RelE/StbE